MKTCAILLGALVLACDAGTAAAAARFRPAAADFLVLTVPVRSGADAFAALERRWRNSPDDVSLSRQLAESYLQRARETRDARFFGRAEHVLARWISRADAPAPLLQVQADILQNRHEFDAALALLDRALSADPTNARSRLMRAAILMVQGRAADARPDCAAVMAAGQAAAGTICLAQVLGATGRLSQAHDLLQAWVDRQLALSPQIQAWALVSLADLADRRGDRSSAERHARAALQADAQSEIALTTLLDLLIARGSAHEALELLQPTRPTVGLLVRRAQAQKMTRDPRLSATLEQIEEQLAISSRRGERPHLREAALLALEVTQEKSRALELAQANFNLQRETLDVRLLSRAARASGDDASLRRVSEWRRQSKFEDVES